ncbi:MAM and CCP domain-containing astacin-like metallopeptidase protein [Leptotrombidium deliense]|uniref:MAM and CCP domain-containing astacin-like metallopeptidase protein n=1 Tax=Leptotrombidium deliense TaxID=299467 RepID=A0A443SME4_9ACAR|nr:MAM and CCP domain-containing astacin-like metallopeptidase protein [Leptotrombidium deliense]
MSTVDKQRLNKMYNCELRKCISPNIIQGTSLLSAKTDDFDIGSIVSYKCNDESLTLIGSKQRLCRFDGQWSGSAAFCTSHLYHKCDFETDFCNWINTNEDWMRSDIAKPSENTGPIVDHTMGTSTGHFIFTDSTSKRSGDKSSILTPNIEVSSTNGQNLCILFAYYLWGEHIGNFKVYLNRVNSGAKMLIFQTNGSLGPNWKIAKFAIQCESSELINLEFEVNFIATSLSDFAIDDFSLFTCSKEQIDAQKFETVEVNLGR